MEWVGLIAWGLSWALIAKLGRKNGWGGIKRHAAGAIAGFVLFAALIPTTSQQSPNTQPQAVASAAPAKAVVQPPAETEAASASVKPLADAAQAEERTLDVSLDEYAKNFNALGAKLDPAIKAYVGPVSAGEVNDAATVKIDDDRMITVSLQKGTRNIKELTLIGQGDGSQVSGIYLLLTAMTAAQAAVPESERADIGPAMGRLLKRVQPNHDSVSEVVGGRKVWMNISDFTGFMAGISPADET